MLVTKLSQLWTSACKDFTLPYLALPYLTLPYLTLPYLTSAFNKHRRPTKSVGYFAQRSRLLFP